MHRLFTVPDVLWDISVLLARPELRCSVLVCRIWYTVALPILWRNVDFRVFRFFGDFMKSELSYKYSVSGTVVNGLKCLTPL